jgi:RimJ/RimL family protein N-acetyltransferase
VTVELAPASPDRHYGAVADLMSRVGAERVTAVDLTETDAPRPNKLVRRWVAIADGGRVVGAASLIRYPSKPAGLMDVSIAVEPGFTGRGVGTALVRAVEAVAAEHGATLLRAEARDEDAWSIAFAHRRGFRKARRSIRSVLDLTTFEEGDLTATVARVRATGVQLMSLVDAGDGDVPLRALYAINRTASVDDPASDGTFPDYETWLSAVVGSAGFQREGQFVAAVGDRYVGLAVVSVEDDLNAVSDIAGVDPAYRRRGIATALKLLTLRHARAAGAARIETENDERNHAMLALNRKLGYRPISGYVVLERAREP